MCVRMRVSVRAPTRMRVRVTKQLVLCMCVRMRVSVGAPKQLMLYMCERFLLCCRGGGAS